MDVPQLLSSFPLAFAGLDGLGSTIYGVIAAVLGIGVLIFVHELGHFLVAKWAGVRVKVFSLGFGPRLFGFERGGTDYRLSALPLGGYVQMLGQDDADPDEQRTDDPGDFRNKSVGKRMAILVAGVAMNALFAVVAFIVAFAIGVDFTAPEVGAVVPGSAAEKAQVRNDAEAPRGLRRGDQVIAIDGKEILAFEDISTIVALAHDTVTIDVDRPTGSGPKRITFIAKPQKDEDRSFPEIGIGAAEGVSTASTSAATAAAAIGLRANDQVVGVAPVTSEVHEMKPEDIERFIQDHPGERVRMLVLRREFDEDGRPIRREDARLEITIGASPEYELGLEFHDEARVHSVTIDSPAKGRIEPGDVVVSIDGQKATATNLRSVVHEAGEKNRESPDARRARPVRVVVLRPVKRDGGRELEEKTFEISLERRANREGWFLGVGYGADRVKAVAPGSPAAAAGIEPGDRVTQAKTERWLGLVWRGGRQVDRDRLNALVRGRRDEEFQLVCEKPSGDERKAVVAARRANRTYGDLPGLEFEHRRIVIRRGVGEACVLGVSRTVRMTEQLFLTLRALVTRRVSARELGGPIKIIGVTYAVAQKTGFGKLLYFLALLSVNLAVLNILPIPVLDGGHLFFLTLEKLKGRPLSENVLIYTQWVGIFLILGLMVAVTFNDIRSWFE